MLSPPMWKNGYVCNEAGGSGSVAGVATGGLLMRSTAAPKATARKLVTWLRCDPNAPLGRPVVPDV